MPDWRETAKRFATAANADAAKLVEHQRRLDALEAKRGAWRGFRFMGCIFLADDVGDWIRLWDGYHVINCGMDGDRPLKCGKCDGKGYDSNPPKPL